jgi:uncharacterized Zn finger protein
MNAERSPPVFILHSSLIIHYSSLLCDMGWYTYKPYVSVAQRKAKSLRHAGKLKEKGQELQPVHVEGLKLGRTFWGKAWCTQIESLSDFASRLPKGKSYVRNDSIIDMQIRPGLITAMVMGSELYSIRIKITPLDGRRWKAMKGRCVGQIGSLVELLQGKLSDSVMSTVTGKNDGLFPKSDEIEMHCSCPDAAEMCKHLAAVLYGVGCRLDDQPELLFKLRQVDHLELLTEATQSPAFEADGGGRKIIAAGDLSDVFGIEVEAPAPEVASVEKSLAPKRPAKRKKRADQL